MNKNRLARLEQVLKSGPQSAEPRCRCDGNRWLCEEGEAPPSHCPTCGGTDPPGRILHYAIVETSA